MRLIERLRWWADECDRTNFGCQARGMLLEAADALEKAEPVKHGRWLQEFEPIPWCDDDVDVFWVCADCECRNYAPTHYCPYCGAKMDLEVSDG